MRDKTIDEVCVAKLTTRVFVVMIVLLHTAARDSRGKKATTLVKDWVRGDRGGRCGGRTSGVSWIVEIWCVALRRRAKFTGSGRSTNVNEVCIE